MDLNLLWTKLAFNTCSDPIWIVKNNGLDLLILGVWGSSCALNLVYLPFHLPPPPPAFSAWPPPRFPLPTHITLSRLPNRPLTEWNRKYIFLKPYHNASSICSFLPKANSQKNLALAFHHHQGLPTRLVLLLLIGSWKHSQLLSWSEAYGLSTPWIWITANMCLEIILIY